MAKSNIAHDADGRTVYGLTIVQWQCSGTRLPPSFYVTIDVPRIGHERNQHALGVSYIYRSTECARAEEYVRAVISSYRNHPRLRYFDAGYFNAVRDAA